MNQFPTTKELEQFCREHGFLYHAHGSGKWGSERYWSYYKVENNDRTVFSIEYFPVSGTARISIANNRGHSVMQLRDPYIKNLYIII